MTSTIFGTSTTVSTDSAIGYGDAGGDWPLQYFNGERMIEFYAPGQAYAALPDDRPLLEKLRSNQLAEMAFSFNSTYSLEEVRDVFGEDAAWFWVDTTASEEGMPDVLPVPAALAYGFHAGESPENGMALSFIGHLEWLQNEEGPLQPEAERLYANLTADGVRAGAGGFTDCRCSGDRNTSRVTGI